MAKLFFHSDVINERGSAAAVYEYMRLCQSNGHEVSWGYSAESPNDPNSIKMYGTQFEIIPIVSFEKFSTSASKEFDWAYFVKKGPNDGIQIPGIPNNIHVVFQYLDPHGDNYAYVSGWLARTMARSTNQFLPSRLRSYFPYTPFNLDYVPFSVELPEPTNSLRRDLGIPQEAKVALRFGGMKTFDIPWVKKVLLECLDEDPNLWFLAVNTERFTTHKRAVFAPTILGAQAKSNMLGSADFVIHARRQGESFGMNILESMQAGKPILSWIGGWDRNHVELLHHSSLYLGPMDFKRKVKAYAASCNVTHNLNIAENYKPAAVFPEFKRVFGSGVL
jgi:hypothetical protein